MFLYRTTIMKPLLSIIMPCFNCVTTLEEAVASLQTQHFNIPYEVIMVDDGSTDSTLDLIKELSKKYPNIHYIAHERNQGGGAARNTGIRASAGTFIFCLDSDNILAPDSLPQMVRYAQEKKCDGVAIHERRFFTPKHHIKKFNSHFNTISDSPITLDDVWNGSNMLLDNFLYTRASYDKTEGYPTEHGFDTQAFEISYLAAGNKVKVCPGTTFYHRQNMGQKSYFERVYEKGEFSINYYLAIEKILHIFSDEVIDAIMKYDVFNKTSLYGENFKTFLDGLYKANRNSFYSDKRKSEGTSPFLNAVQAYNAHNYAEAIEIYSQIDKEYPNLPLVYFNTLRAEAGQRGLPHNTLTLEAYAQGASRLLRPQPSVFKKNKKTVKGVAKKIIRKVIGKEQAMNIKRFIKGNKHIYKFIRGARAIRSRPNIFRRISLVRNFFADLKTYEKMDSGKFNLSLTDLKPCIYDKTANTPVEPIYFYQGAWCASKVFQQKPAKHYDIASSADMLGIISQFVPTVMIDIRPINLNLPGLTFIKGSVLDLPFEDNSIMSLSSICVIEHIGLGRYGDPLDPEGSEKAAREITRVLGKGADLYITVPVDVENKIYFNAHRAFTRDYILSLFSNLKLVEEKYIYGRDLYSSYDPKQGFGTGMYHFQK